MTDFVDESLEHGVRKRAEYRSSQNATMVLNIPRTDGGMLQLPVESNMRSHQEEQEIQQNTFITIVPLGRLPGRDGLGDSPRGSTLREGYLYIFWRNKLWRELHSDGKGGFSDVDVADWRERASAEMAGAMRPAVGVKQHTLVLPAMLQGAHVADDVCLAYSEMPWPWKYIEWLEGSPARIHARTQTLRPAWAAAVIDPQHWQPSQTVPAFQLTQNTRGLCARDLHLETLLEDPYQLTHTLAELPADCLLRQLHQRKQELASNTGESTPEPLPGIAGFSDTLSEYKLRGYPRLVGFILSDPLFTVRHAVAQSRLAAEHLQLLNALVPYQPYGHYAELLYQGAYAPNGPLTSYSHHIDRQALRAANLHDERKRARDYLALLQRRVLELLRHEMAVVYRDWQFCEDELLLEPYALLVEMLELLNRSPAACDPRCVDRPDTRLATDTLEQAKRLVAGTDPISQALFRVQNDGALVTLAALEALQEQGDADPAKMGLSTLSLLSFSSASQSLSAALDEVINHVAIVSAGVVKRLAQSDSVTQVELHRHFAPTLNLANRLHTQAANLRFMPQGEALAKNMVVLGVHGGGYSFGLSAAERQTLTRQNYLYANLESKGGRTVATSSGKAAERMGFASRELGKIMVVAAEANDPLIDEYRQWRQGAVRQQALNAVSRSAVLPGIATAAALVSLYVNVHETITSKNGRDLADDVKAGIAFTDLVVAANNLSLRILNNINGQSVWHVFWEKGRFQTSGFWAKNLVERTGSSWLNWTRVGSTAALGLNALLFAWDSGRAFRIGDDAAGLGNLVAMSGAGMWALYTVGLLASPWALAIGLALVIGGASGAAILRAGQVEQAIMHGPFGKARRLPHMDNPLTAYQQLLGSMGQSRVTIERMADWWSSANTRDQIALNLARGEARITLSPSDWVVELYCPLLSQFEDGRYIQLQAREVQRTRSHSSGWNYSYRRVQGIRLNAVVLDANRLLFVLPSAFDLPGAGDYLRLHQTFEHGLRIFAQFQLGEPGCRVGDAFPGYGHIVLPQPEPREWQAYSPSDRPAERNTSYPYWLIEQSEFFKA
ncbi:toxin VasX [Pseudomonas sp. MYb185]|uniref:toxin VasX n=1 Tax=Pseudomonas sp. MYb185 TaxID=1848729 RepID=UPI000CFBBAB8|nr:toxin VasX [Pseudomonas sp. MYb185]PRB81024.1 hypothetical protein CQ007_11860 [Pseudomonas sp. MYb185]